MKGPTNLWEYRIAAIAGDCKSPGRKAYVGASPTAPTILIQGKLLNVWIKRL